MSVAFWRRTARRGQEPAQQALGSTDLSAAEAAMAAAGSLTVRSLLFGTGPRFAGDAFGPVLAFYVGWKLAGTVVGIVVATAVGVLAWYAARRRERPGAVALLSLGFVFVQAAVGLAFDSARVYLAQQVVLSAAFGFAFLISVAVRRPLAGLFARDIFPFPDEVKRSATFRSVFTRISLAWGLYQVLRGAIRLGALSKASIDAYVVVNFVTSAPLVVAMMTWSIWYAVGAFRRSAEWGWALRGEEPPPEVAAAYMSEIAAQSASVEGPAVDADPGEGETPQPLVAGGRDIDPTG